MHIAYTRMYDNKPVALKKIFRRVVSAIKYCHDSRISHRDLKFDNILINEGKKVKIIDFGFAVRQRDDSDVVSTYCGTPTFMSPEIVKRIPHDPSKADVWALGIVLYKLVMNRYPFKANTDQELNSLILKGELHISKSVDSEIRRLICGMLDRNETSRYTLHDVLNSDWLKED